MKNLNSKTESIKLTEKEVEHVAKLANLTLTDQEVKKFQQQLSAILDYVEILDQTETKEVEPTSQVTGQENVTRDDIVSASLSQEEALSGVGERVEKMFKTKVILSDM